MRWFLRVVKNALLLLVLPLFWWGPVVHPHINRLALRKAEKELEAGDRTINEDMVRRLKKNEEAFFFGGNSADAVSAYHVLSNISIYDYAHNAIPDEVNGIPHFGYTLIDEWWRAYQWAMPGIRYTDHDFAVACGWLAHQLADWYPHYAAVDCKGNLVDNGYAGADNRKIFSGFSNSHRVFGADYYPEILASYVVADHALIEFFFDLLVMQGDRGFFDRNRVELFETRSVGGKLRNLLTAASERYYGHAVRIPPEHIPQLADTFNSVIRGIQFFIELAVFLRPSLVYALKNTIDPAITGGPDYIQLSIDRVVDGLFRKSYGEISQLSRERVVLYHTLESRSGLAVVKRPGNIFFPVVRQLGTIINLNQAIPVLRGFEHLSVPIRVGFIKIRIDLPGQLAKLLISFIKDKGVDNLFKRNHDTNALMSFLEELLVDDGADLSVPLRNFKASLKPVAELDGDEHLTEAELLKQMIERRQIGVRLVPATSPEQPDYCKLLNSRRLLFRVDGYEVKEYPAVFKLREKWNGNVLELTCSLLKELKAGVHHLFVDIWDNSNIHSRYLDLEVSLVDR